jgi:hypothetical protein
MEVVGGMSHNFRKDVVIENLEGDRRLLIEMVETAIRWLRRLEREYPGCLNADAIEKHLERPLREIDTL